MEITIDGVRRVSRISQLKNLAVELDMLRHMRLCHRSCDSITLWRETVSALAGDDATLNKREQ